MKNYPSEGFPTQQGDVKVALNSKHEARNPKQIQNLNVQNQKQKQHGMMLSDFEIRISCFKE
jgi:hypothetical protein